MKVKLKEDFTINKLSCPQSKREKRERDETFFGSYMEDVEQNQKQNAHTVLYNDNRNRF